MGIQLLRIITTEIWVISRRQSVNQHVTEDFSPKGQLSLAPFTQTNLYSRTRKGLKMVDIPYVNYHLHPISPCERKKHLENILMSLATPNYIQKRWSIGWFLACQVRYGLAPKVNLIGEGMSLTCAANTFSNCSNSNTCLLFQEHRVGHWSKWLIRTDNEPGQQKTKWWTNPKGICRTSFKRSRSDQISDLHKYWDVLYFYGCNVHKSWIYWSSGQIIIFHQPRFPCFPAIFNGIPGIPHATLPFGLRSFLGPPL